MFDLLRSEGKRFRLWASIFAFVHLATLGFFTRIIDPLQQPLLVYQIFGGIYALVGLLLAIVQFAGHRRPSSWLFLLHRPLAPRRIAGALLGAGGLLLALVVALPLALAIGGQAAWSARVVDHRHWLLPVAALLISVASYLAGAFAMLSPVRGAFLVFVLPALFTASAAHGVAAIAIQMLVNAALAGLVLLSFRPDLSSPPSGRWARLAIHLPLATAVYLLLVGIGGLAFQLGWILLGTHPLNSTPPRGGFVEASRAAGADLLLAGLAGAEGEELEVDRVHVGLAEVHSLAREFDRLPRRHELTNIAPVEFDDESRGVRWTFSHDSMRFHGVRLADGGSTGVLGHGPVPGEALPVPPLVPGAGAVLAGEAIYAFDAPSAELRERLRLPAGEILASNPVLAGETIALLTDRSLLFFAPRTARGDESGLEPRLRVALPGAIGDLTRADFVERLDGYLISFVFGRGTVDGPGAAWQLVVRAGSAGSDTAGGSVKTLARRELLADFPAAVRHRRFWLSPALQQLHRAAVGLFANSSPLVAQERPETPRGAWLAAAMLSLLALGGTAWMLRGRLVDPLSRLTWLATSALLGPPATVAFWLLRPDRLFEAREPKAWAGSVASATGSEPESSLAFDRAAGTRAGAAR